MASKLSEEDISVQTLAAGLRNNDVSAVISFCRTADQVFASLSHRVESKSKKQKQRNVQYSEHKLQQYMAALKLISSYGLECLQEKQFLGFVQQTLKIVLDHLTRNVKQVVTSLQQVQVAGLSNPEVEAQSDRLLTTITDSIMQLKTILAKIPVNIEKKEKANVERRERRGSISSIASERLESGPQFESEISDNQKQLLKVWNTLDKRAVIVEGILNGEIELLLQYLAQRFDPEVADWMHVISTGLNETLIFLLEKEMGYAKKMIKNMGFDPNTKLRQIFLYTLDKHLRDYLANELETQGALTQEELDMLKFVHQLEELYPCVSYEVAKSMRYQSQPRRFEEICDLRLFLTGGDIDIAKYCGDLVSSQNIDKNTESKYYSHNMLEWLRSFDTITKQRILLSRGLTLKEPTVPILEGIPPIVIWNYLCLHQDFSRLQKWIHCEFIESRSHETMEKRDPDTDAAVWPYMLGISQDMMDDLSGATKYTRERILNELARYGQFCSEELKDFEKLLTRLSELHAIFSKPNILESSQHERSMNLTGFHKNMIKHCLDRNLPRLLYFYIDYWGLRVTREEVEDVQRGGELPAWLTMLLRFSSAARAPRDGKQMFAASLACSAHVQCVPDASIDALIDHGLIVTALATLAFSQSAFQQFITDPTENAKQAVSLMQCPTLNEALMEDRHLTNISTFTSLYQLLQGNIVFDPGSLFGWQSANKLATDEAVAQLPYFSQPQLVQQHGYKEALACAYYIKHGRPSFAFCRLLLDYGVTDSLKQAPPPLLRKMGKKLHWLGVKHFCERHVTAACAAVMEMLGHDSTLFRVHVQAANQIAHHLCADLKASLEDKKLLRTSIQKDVAHKLHRCFLGKQSAIDEVAYVLEQAINSTFEKHPHVDRTSTAAETRWLVLQAFCKCHALPASTAFLRHCAARNAWLAFLTHAQTHQLPIHQVENAAKEFEDPVLREHFKNILNVMHNQSKTQIKEDASRPPLDFRAKLYASVGVTKEHSSTDDEEGFSRDTDSDPAPRGHQTQASPEQHECGEVEVATECVSVLDLVRECEASPQPAKLLCQHARQARNPILALIGACYKEADRVTCLCSWLFASLPPDSCQSALVYKSECALQDLSLLWQAALHHNCTLLLHSSFQLFFPKSVIISFLDFMSQLLNYMEESTVKNALNRFQDAWKNMKQGGMTLDSEVFPIAWFEQEVVTTVCYQLCNKSQVHTLLKLLDQSHFLNLLDPVNKIVPNIELLHQLSLLVRDEQIEIHYQNLLEENKAEFREELLRIVQCLEWKTCWNKARMARELAKLPSVDVTVNQLKAELEELKASGVWRCEGVQAEFWCKAEKILTKDENNLVDAATFFKEQAERSTEPWEKQYLYEVAHTWLSKSGNHVLSDQRSSLFTHIWRNKIHAHMQAIDKSDSPEHKSTKKPHLQTSFNKSQLRKLDPSSLPEEVAVQLSADEAKGLEELLGEMLDSGQILQAMEVTTHFGHSNSDLNIISTCHKLASGALSPDALDVESRKLMEGPRRMRRRQSSIQMISLPRMASSVSVASRLSELGDVLIEEDATLSCMNLLTQQCTHGTHACQLVLSIYQIAKLLGIDYKEALAIDEFALLGHVVSSELPTRYLLAKSFIQAAALVDSQVAGFLSDLVVETLEVHLGISGRRGGASGAGSGRKLVMWELVQLCADAALLGHRLLHTTVTSKASNLHPSVQTLQLEVELLIYAHDCFTLACHMEGISQLLRVCRSVTQRLHEAEQYATLVSFSLSTPHPHYAMLVTLLTGVGRYSEMTYIFDILKSQHQFELLFRKRTDKENKLKLAILDYLERYHKEDTETYTMVALHFTMYRQIASMLHQSATQLLRQVSHLPIDNSTDMQKKLHKILNYLSDAAESYIKEGCVRQAEECVRQARLVALQIQLLPNRTRVLNLETPALTALLPNLAKTSHVHIVLQAYGESRLWSEVFFHQLVKKGDFKLVKELSQYCKITPNLLNDVAERLESSQSPPTKQQLINMQRLLGLCRDVQVVHALSVRLGLHDLSQQLLKGPTGAYLHDTLTIK